ncbi:hypothetical protein SAMN05443529_10448 [Desulfosporosinus hippei DSM 8344]|uniref:Uncharacterized protein n=1 Tax=Desulfosporosinus hippei DSM 8344 TaxID=1121419 RepID=A0A1G7V9F9_9FIRM|nr:hypothetical protein SAMN05443529_10448 [Desulfosporosinus hippei DSM 8344]
MMLEEASIPLAEAVWLFSGSSYSTFIMWVGF